MVRTVDNSVVMLDALFSKKKTVFRFYGGGGCRQFKLNFAELAKA
jgi:hypothetical protein